MHRAALDWVRDLLLAADPEPSDPAAWLFLLRDFMVNGHLPTGDAVERGLTAALRLASVDADPCRRVQWVRLLAESVLISDDGRLGQAVESALPSAIDLLEQQVRRWYEPGEGLVGQPVAANLAHAHALLDAFDLTGRLPYSMMADELIQLARRHPDLSPDAARFDPLAGADLLRAITRMARLHADPEYQTVAVVPPQGDDTAEAARLATVLADQRGDLRTVAHVGLALLEWFALEPKLQ